MKPRNMFRTLFVLLVALVTSVVDLSPGPTLVRQAEAVVGRPLTPVSYAGVARRTSRRTTRRAVYAGAAAPSPYW
jgi:hypothetical protein